MNATTNPYAVTPPPTDTTLTQEGVAADAKAVGEALKAAELIVKHQSYSVTTDIYAQTSIRVPDNCTAALYFTCNDAIVWPQGYRDRVFSLRCFGHITGIELNGLRNTTLSIELYYL